jgi:tRNA G18 (ribose-2'-O)-methylase SpoU
MRKLRIEEMDRLSVEDFKSAQKTPIILVLENIRSLSNVGSLFRTADAFGLEKIILTGITAKPPHRDIQKTALGATESVDWEYFNSVNDFLKNYKGDYWTTCLEQAEGSTKLDELPISKPKGIILIVGNEVSGVEQETINVCKMCFEIPQVGTKHSLNVAVSGGVALWEVFKWLK